MSMARKNSRTGQRKGQQKKFYCKAKVPKAKVPSLKEGMWLDSERGSELHQVDMGL